jgi:hypothetical protein
MELGDEHTSLFNQTQAWGSATQCPHVNNDPKLVALTSGSRFSNEWRNNHSWHVTISISR